MHANPGACSTLVQVLRLTLDTEVKASEARAQRSKTTGSLVITMPKVDPNKARGSKRGWTVGILRVHLHSSPVETYEELVAFQGGVHGDKRLTVSFLMTLTEMSGNHRPLKGLGLEGRSCLEINVLVLDKDWVSVGFPVSPASVRVNERRDDVALRT